MLLLIKVIYKEARRRFPTKGE